MSKLPPQFRQVSREVVRELASRELELFDELWEDFSENPDMELLGSRLDSQELRGGGVELSLMTALLMPVVVQVLSHVIKLGVDSIKDQIIKRWKAQGQEISEQKAREMANIIIVVVQRHQTDREQNK